MTTQKSWCHECHCWHGAPEDCPVLQPFSSRYREFSKQSPVAPEQPVTRAAFTTQVGGDHYAKLAIQPMDYSMKNGLDPLQHTIIKYVTRFRDKSGVEDLRKAIHTLELLIEYEEAKGG